MDKYPLSKWILLEEWSISEYIKQFWADVELFSDSIKSK